MKILVLCDDRWHPAATVKNGLAPLAARCFEFDFVEDARDWSAEKMARYNVVILSKSNHGSSTEHEPWMTPEIENAFLDYVRCGNGLLAIHSGTSGYQKNPTLRALLGGVFVRHPPQCETMIVPCESHVLCDASTRFAVWDEHYFMELDDKAADVFLTTESEHGAQPAGWTRAEGEGRVCILTPGHNLDVWLHPSYQVLIENALRWCAK
jgi:uncharacterized protein